MTTRQSLLFEMVRSIANDAGDRLKRIALAVGNWWLVRALLGFGAWLLFLPWRIFDRIDSEHSDSVRHGLRAGIAQGSGCSGLLIILCFLPFIATRALVEFSSVGESKMEREAQKIAFTLGWVAMIGVIVVFLRLSGSES